MVVFGGSQRRLVYWADGAPGGTAAAGKAAMCCGHHDALLGNPLRYPAHTGIQARKQT